MKKKILQDDWLSHPSIHYLSTVFQRSGYEILFVGGCVRNTILKKNLLMYHCAAAVAAAAAAAAASRLA